jgi:hypothetical protein
MIKYSSVASANKGVIDGVILNLSRTLCYLKYPLGVKKDPSKNKHYNFIFLPMQNLICFSVHKSVIQNVLKKIIYLKLEELYLDSNKTILQCVEHLML